MPQTRHTNGKTRITIRIDDDLLEWFRAQAAVAQGGNYQTLINLALREYVQNCDQPLEEILRRVIREELSASRALQATYKSNTSRPI
jgi:Arc/MetJ family transcription regulator